MRRYLETLFRRRDIFLVPVIVTPLIALGLVLLAGAKHEVKATIWVEPSPFMGTEETSRRAGDPTPNQLEAQALTEWLSTDSFRARVLDRSGLARAVQEGSWPRLNGVQRFSRDTGLDSVPGLGGLLRALGLAGPSNVDQAMGVADGTVKNNISAEAEGNNLLLVSYVGSQPGLGTQLVEAVIAVYQESTAERRAEVAQRAIELQTGQVEAQQQRVQEASAAMNDFLVRNPAPRSPAQESELDRLRRTYELEQGVYEDALRALSELRSQANTVVSGTTQSIQVIDPPRVPADGGTSSRVLLMTVFLGVVIGLALGAAGIALITWTDRTLRTPEDASDFLDAPIVAQVHATNGHKNSPHMAWLMVKDHERR